MDEARSNDQWDHTAMMIVAIRGALGDKEAKFERIHPAHAAKHNARELKKHKQQSKKNRKPKEK